MNDFQLYFSLGWEHIITWEALDHLLFIAVLTSAYELSMWKKLLVLITAFTLGHSISLALASYRLIRPDQQWVEFLIPLTIVLTSIYQIIPDKKKSYKTNPVYWMSMFFGLIHGLGFAGAISGMLSVQESIALPLLSFNIGIEAAQIMVVVALILLSQALNGAGLKKQWWKLLICILSGLVAGVMCIERWPMH